MGATPPPGRRPAPVIGLVGGIGSGKSWVARCLAGHDGRIVSGDALGHEALRQPDLRGRVVARWGPGVLDAAGQVDRRELGRRVFADAGERKALEAIVHPWIGHRLAEELDRHRFDPDVRVVVLDAAIMLEAGWNNRCDRVVYVHAPRSVRLARLAAQRGWSAEEVAAREAAQLPLTDKVTRADAAVENTGPPEFLPTQIDALLARWGVGSCPLGTGGPNVDPV